MKIKRAVLTTVLALTFVLCIIFAFGCSDKKTYYAVTFMDGQTQVGQSVEVEKGRKIPEYPKATRSDSNYVFDAWYKDEGLTTVWNHDIERVTRNTTLYAGYLYVLETPGNAAMDNGAFSNTLSWLQRDITADTQFKVEILGTQIVSGGKQEFVFESYKGHTDIYTVKWTPAEKPLGGTYSVKITCEDMEAVTIDDLVYKGAGTADNPYLISSQTDLAAVNTQEISGGYYKISQSFTARVSQNAVADKTFDGVLDGNGRTITLEASDCGLFGTLGKNAEVKDITVAGAVANVQTNCVGAIAGVNRGKISYCTVSANLDSTVGTVGTLSGNKDGIEGGASGVAGINYGEISCCTYSGTVKSSVGGAGIAVINNGTISLCSFTGTIGAANSNETGNSTKAYSFIGGIAAINYSVVEKSSIDGSGKILAQRGESGANDYVGGIVAVNETGATVRECWFDGIRVHGNRNVGGITGANSGTVAYCYAGGDYHGGNAKVHSYIGGLGEVGGIVGLTNGGKVTNCFVTSNVYAYAGNAYKVASNCENCVYLDGNLDAREGVSPVTASEDNGNIKIALSEGYSSKAYPLVLNDTQLALLNGTSEAFTNKNNVRPTCEGEVTEVEHIITVAIDGRVIGAVSDVKGDKISLKNYRPEDVPAGHYFAGWAIAVNGEAVFGETEQISYSSLEKYGKDNLTLYPVFIEGEKPQSKVLSVALWTRYVNEDTAKALFEAYKASTYFADGYEVVYTALNSSNNNNFKADYDNGEFNVALAYKAAAVDAWQVSSIEVYIFSVNDNAYTTLKVGLNSSDDVVKNFGEFLKSDAAKKIMNPAYVSESEADKIEITLICDGEQYGEKLTVSNATEAVKVKLDKIEEIPEGFVSFLGWATAQTEVEGETYLTGSVGYDDLKDLATDGKLTLYARFSAEEKPQILLSIAVYGRYIDESYARAFVTAFCTAQEISAELVETDIIEGDKLGVADFSAIVNDGYYDIILACGGNIDSEGNVDGVIGKTSITVKGQTGRYIAILTENEVAQAMYAFVKTDAGKKALNPDFISEEEAQKIEITLMNGDTQYGGKLTVSNATEAVKVKLPEMTAEEGYVFSGWALTAEKQEDEAYLSGNIGYDDIKHLATGGSLTLYVRYEEGERQQVLSVAVWTRYVQEDTVKNLLQAFKNSDYFVEGALVACGNLNSNNNDNFKKDYEDGGYNIAFGYKSNTVDNWQDDIFEIYIYNVSTNVMDTLKVGVNSTDEIALNFAEFLETDAAKKIMNPAYVSEAEADKIEITLMNGEEQFGEKLTVSNATEAKAKVLPEVEEITDGYVEFLGWATTEEEVDGETLFTDLISYADVESLATDKKVMLYARFSEEAQPVILKVAVYEKFISQEVATALEGAFIKYCTDNSLEYDELHIDLMTTGNGSAFMSDSAGYDVVLGHKGGTSFKPAEGEYSSIEVQMFYVDGGVYKLGDRKAERLTANKLAVTFMKFLQEDEDGIKALKTGYVSEEEADTIEITLMNGDTQYGEKLTVSNATEAEDITLPALSAEDGYTFAGWETEDGEACLSGEIDYDDVKDLTDNGTLVLYARFEEISLDDNSLTVVFYDKFFDSDKVEPLKTAFVAYCTENEISYGVLDFKCEITGNNAALNTYLTETIKGGYDVAVGSKQTKTTAVDCLKDKTRVEVTYVYDGKAAETRDAVQNNERVITLAFMAFIQSSEAGNILNPAQAQGE